MVNLYPFLNTVTSGADRETIIENIDIGGPSMVRSAAKNHAYVAIVTDPADYSALIVELDANGGTTSLELRRKLAAKAFALTAEYNLLISQWFAFADQGQRWPPSWTLSAKLKMPLRYGENPHQTAALYVPAGPLVHGVAQAKQMQGKELSYNNLNDANAALELVAEFRDAAPTVVIVKHANPCGVATRDELVDAWNEALACDSVSAFGGIVATNCRLDAATAEAITAIFTEVVVAPEADDEAKAIFARKKNLRLLLTGALPDPARTGSSLAVIAGGLLVQDRDNGAIMREQLKCVDPRQPTEQEVRDCLFAWTVAKHVKSNAIVYAKDGVTAGIGAGQMNRRDSSPALPPRSVWRQRKPAAGRSRGPSARPSPPTPSSPSPMGCSLRPKPVRRRSFSRAARSATTKSSRQRTRRASRCCSRECVTFGTEARQRDAGSDQIGLGLIAGERSVFCIAEVLNLALSKREQLAVFRLEALGPRTAQTPTLSRARRSPAAGTR